jgi:hypothetical protein
MTEQTCNCDTPAACGAAGTCRKAGVIQKETVSSAQGVTLSVNMTSYAPHTANPQDLDIRYGELSAAWNADHDGLNWLAVDFGDATALAAFLAVEDVPESDDNSAWQWEADDLYHAEADIALKAMEIGIAAIADPERRTRMAEALARIIQERRETIRASA